MSNNPPTPFNPQPGKMTTKVECFHTQSGQRVEIRWVTKMIYENNIWKDLSFFEVWPPLADNRIPQSVDDIRECVICLKLYHRDNVLLCPICGRTFGHCCKDVIKTKNTNEEILVCLECGQEENRGLVSRLLSKVGSPSSCLARYFVTA